MPDTLRLEAAELAYYRERHQEAVFERDGERIGTGECVADDQPFPCDAATLLAHIDALTAAVEALPRDRGDDKWDTVSRAAVLAILRGEHDGHALNPDHIEADAILRDEQNCQHMIPAAECRIVGCGTLLDCEGFDPNKLQGAPSQPAGVSRLQCGWCGNVFEHDCPDALATEGV